MLFSSFVRFRTLGRVHYQKIKPIISINMKTRDGEIVTHITGVYIWHIYTRQQFP